jgi:hypothetical protein
VNLLSCSLAPYAVISGKGRETEYSRTRDEVMKMYGELNVMLQKAQIAIASAGGLGGISAALGATGATM